MHKRYIFKGLVEMREVESVELCFTWIGKIIVVVRLSVRLVSRRI